MHRTSALVGYAFCIFPSSIVLVLYIQLHPPSDRGLLLLFLVSWPSMARLMAAPGFPSDLEEEEAANLIGKSLGVSL